jgi:hypothetical protein
MARGHTFENSKKKREMLNYRKQGYTYLQIARKYGADRTTIIYHCQRAGLSLKDNVRIKLYDLIDQGFSPSEVALELKIPSTVVEFYCDRYKVIEGRLFVNKKLNLEPISSEPSQKKYSRSRGVDYKIDERGVEWRKDLNDQWVCMGKTMKQRRLDEVNKKKRLLEEKRLDMLTY